MPTPLGFLYKRLSEKLEALIQQHRDNWELLAEGYEQLRAEANAQHGRPGLDRPADESFLRHQPGEFALIVDAHGTAQHHEQVQRVGLR